MLATSAKGTIQEKCCLKKRTRIMGIVNLTQDSFSGDGLLSKNLSQQAIVEHVKDLIALGADIIDIGGESSRPGSKPVSLEEELARTIPVIEALSGQVSVPISIDTYKPEVARAALEAGASIVNDITGLRNPEMIKVIAAAGATVIIMHMKGEPVNMQDNPEYTSVVDEIIEYLKTVTTKAVGQGIDKAKIIVDPGIGFGKTTEHNLQILHYLNKLKALGYPILVGTSRKSFIGKILNLTPRERLSGTLASVVVAVTNGADIVRVHDVRSAVEAIKITDSILMS